MKTFKNKYRGFTIVMKEINPDRIEYEVQKEDGTVVNDSDGFTVTTSDAQQDCKDFIDDLLDS